MEIFFSKKYSGVIGDFHVYIFFFFLDGFSRSTSQSCIDTTNRTNEDVTCLQQSLEDRRSRTYNYDTKSQEQSQNVKMRDQSQSPEHSNLHSTSRKRLSEGGMEPDAKRHPEPSFGKLQKSKFFLMN